MSMNRRNFLKAGWRAGIALLGAAAAWTSYELLRPLAALGTGGKLKLGSASDYAPGTATYVREGRLFVANADGHYFALSQKCPHLGCRVDFCESSGHFECPCHGSVFDLAGEWISGPSPRGMDRFERGFDGDTFFADTSKRTDGPNHGASQFFKPAKGPKCTGNG
jgi:cytochrome b6-f complex iron-sulfur subunit